jgi:hypothetical protein
MVNVTDRDDFDLLLSESVCPHDARSTGTWRTTLLGVPWLGGLPRPLVRQSAITGKIGGDIRGAAAMSAHILRGHTVALLLNAMNRAGACRTRSDHRRAG